jgi:ribosomal protein S18 acetylase RimI-like enzyme
MKHTLQFQSITDSDLPFLYEVYSSTRMEEMKSTGWSKEQINQFLTMQFNLQHSHYTKHYPNANFDIVMLKDQQIGRLYIDRGEHDILIIDIALLPQYQKQGIGYQLMKSILDEAKEKNLLVHLHVEKYNPALQFYFRLGFQIQEDKDVYYYLRWSP